MNFSKDKKDIKFWQQEGKQTQVTERIKKVVKSIQGDGLLFAISALEWIGKNIKLESQYPKKRQFFRKRTADQIIRDRFTTGCTDTALVFIALARAREIPTKYIEAIDRKWLESKSDKNIKGHVFAKIFINGKWYLADPARGYLSVKSIPNKNQYIILDEGLDSWDIEIREFADLKERFKKFKENFHQI